MRIVRALYHYFIPQKMPNLSANYYEKLIDGVSDFYLQPFCQKILEKYPGQTRMLDVGTGTGQLPIMLAKNNENYQLTAIDLSEKCLEIARSKAAFAGVGSRVTFTCIDLLQDNWDIEPFDLIISTCSLHHWQKPERILTKVRQLLEENGEMWILDDFADASTEARNEWIKKVEDACKPGWLFRTIFNFESKFLAYTRLEIEEICENIGFYVTFFSNEGVFFIAQMTRKKAEI